MNPNASSCRTLAFTLVEMLVVIAIIGILAALLMPVLNKAEQRAKRIVCVDDLGQVGLAFHTFSNDHNGKYPMAISTNDGGSMEFVESGFAAAAAGEAFYTAFRNFQPLSGELVNPQLLICPADVRPVATNFESLQNYNLSYFVGVEATFDKPGSILAGDQNLVTNGWVWPFIMPFPGPDMSWTWTMHQFKGNVVFADGHVEQWNNSSLAEGESESPFNQSFFMPICPGIAVAPGTASLPGSSGAPNSGPGDSSSPGSTGSGPASSPPTGPLSEQWAGSPTKPSSMGSPSSQGGSPADGSPMPSPNSFSGEQRYTKPAAQAPGPDQNLVAADAPPPSADTDAVVSVQDPNAGMSQFDRHMTMVMQSSLIWLYILLCILVLLYLLFRHIRRKMELRARQWENEPRL